jgi:hypothetical protein
MGEFPRPPRREVAPSKPSGSPGASLKNERAAPQIFVRREQALSTADRAGRELLIWVVGYIAAIGLILAAILLAVGH